MCIRDSHPPMTPHPPSPSVSETALVAFPGQASLALPLPLKSPSCVSKAKRLGQVMEDVRQRRRPEVP